VTIRALREEVVRWAMRAGAPERWAGRDVLNSPATVHAQPVEASAAL